MARIRTYGFSCFAPRDWPITPSPNGNRIRTVIVAATSVAEAIRLFQAAGLSVNRYQMDNWGLKDMGGLAATAATSDPGRLFYAPDDPSHEYVPVPDQA